MRARATVGEISDAMEQVFGRHRAVIRSISGVYGGGLGVESLIEHGTPDASGEVVGAQR